MVFVHVVFSTPTPILAHELAYIMNTEQPSSPVTATQYTWAGRFSEPMSDLVKRYTASVDFDKRMSRQHSGVRQRAVDVLPPHAFVEIDRGRIALDEIGHWLGETSGPGVLCRIRRNHDVCKSVG